MAAHVRRWSTSAGLVALALSAVVALPSDAAAPPRAVPRAVCGAGDLPETGLQGQVPLADRQSGRSRRGYRCGLALVGQHQGRGASWVSASAGRCAYVPQAVPSSLTSGTPGVQVVDVSRPSRPRAVGALTSPAFLTNPWESLKVHEGRRLLAGVSGGALEGAGAFDVYDVSDCARPRLLNSVSGTALSLPRGVLGHEGGFSPDGRTYWATGGAPGTLAAIDVSDPRRPRTVWTGTQGVIDHGVSFSPDGRRLHLSTIEPQGVRVLDVSEVQDRRPSPQVHAVGELRWDDGANAQHTVAVTYRGRPHLLAVDEQELGGVRVLDLGDPRRPRLVSNLRLEVQLPQHAAVRAADLEGTGLFGYDAHYCAVDRPADPRLAACGFFQSGVRVLDVRDPRAVREVAYYVPPARTGENARLTGSEHAQGAASGGGPGGLAVSLTADWCSSPPRFVAPDQLWVTCTDNGLQVLRFTRDPLRG